MGTSPLPPVPPASHHRRVGPAVPRRGGPGPLPRCPVQPGPAVPTSAPGRAAHERRPGGCAALPAGSRARWPRIRRRIYEWRALRAGEDRGEEGHARDRVGGEPAPTRSVPPGPCRSPPLRPLPVWLAERRPPPPFTFQRGRGAEPVLQAPPPHAEPPLPWRRSLRPRPLRHYSGLFPGVPRNREPRKGSCGSRLPPSRGSWGALTTPSFTPTWGPPGRTAQGFRHMSPPFLPLCAEHNQ